MEKSNKKVKNIGKPTDVITSYSISSLLGLLSEPFDSKAVAEKTYNKHHNNPGSEYYQMSIDEIIKKWENKGKISLHYGRLNDKYIGIVLEGTETDKQLFELDNDIEGDEKLKIQVDSFNSFIDNKPEHIEYIGREITVYYKINDNYIKGRLDALFYDTKRNKYLLIDWKSGNVDIKPNNFTSKLLGPAKDLDALNYNIYTLQTQLYKTALVEGNYLDEGTTFNDIEVYIVNFPGKADGEGKLYKTLPEAFTYNKEYIDKIFDYTIKKYKLMNNGK